MSVDYKKEIEEAVLLIELNTRKTRSEIARELGYSDTYISTAISRGGTKKLLDRIKHKYEYVFSGNIIPPPGNADQALLKALLEDYIRLKAQVTGKSVDDISDEIEQNTKIILRGLR